MIRCNLSILLAERNLKISKVSKDTHLSRTTLTSLCNNDSLGIQFETLNTLCTYLNVSTQQIIYFHPLEVDATAVQDDEFIIITLNFYESNKDSKKTISLPLKVTMEKFLTNSLPHNNFIFYIDFIDSNNVDMNTAQAIKLFKEIPKTFIPYIEDKILGSICSIDTEGHLDVFGHSFKWPAQLF